MGLTLLHIDNGTDDIWFGPFGPASIGASAKTATGISAEPKSDANSTELMISMRSPIAIDE
jgi:hypothetical protein